MDHNIARNILKSISEDIGNFNCGPINSASISREKNCVSLGPWSVYALVGLSSHYIEERK